jgi:ribosomal protein S27E
MKINCLSCGHGVVVDEVYSDYEGAIRCYACGALLDVKLTEGRIQSVKLSKRAGRAAAEVR